jgi:hypothetical protein
MAFTSLSDISGADKVRTNQHLNKGILIDKQKEEVGFKNHIVNELMQWMNTSLRQ